MTNGKHKLINTARVTGFWYLMLAISGILGFLVVHPQIFVANDPESTLTNVINNETMARIRLILEFLIVISQALTAVYFYKLFKTINEWAAWSLGIWGTLNSVIIMMSAVSIATIIAISESTIPVEHQVLLVEGLSSLGANAWGVGSLFFGLWLIPMGYIITSSGRMPVWLGRILIIGGAGYILSTVLGYSGIEYAYINLLTVPATIGEFWMIGYLLIFGIRPSAEYESN